MHAAARVLAVEGGIGATTLQRLLTRYREIGEGTATVEKITPARVHVRMHSGKTVRFAHDDDLRHIDHA